MMDWFSWLYGPLADFWREPDPAPHACLALFGVGLVFAGFSAAIGDSTGVVSGLLLMFGAMGLLITIL